MGTLSKGLGGPPGCLVRRVKGKGYSSGSSSSLGIVSKIRLEQRKVYLRQLPRDVILGAQTLMGLLQTGKVARSHHASTISGRSWHGEWPGDLLLDARNKVLLLIAAERVGIGSAKSQLSGLDVLHTHSLPVEKIAQTLSSVSLVDTLTTALGAEIEHERCKLVDRVIDTLCSAVHNVDTIVARVLNKLLHVASETRKVGGNAGNTHNRTLGRGITPRLVVRGKDTQMATSHEIIVVQGKDRVGGVQELRVENNLDTVRRVVEELNPSDLVQNGVFVVINHVVGNDRGESMSLHGE